MNKNMKIEQENDLKNDLQLFFHIFMLFKRGKSLVENKTHLQSFALSKVFCQSNLCKDDPHLIDVDKALSKHQRTVLDKLSLEPLFYDTGKQTVNPPWLGKYLKLQS